MIKEKIFREYDIRGVVGEDFDDASFEMMGRALAQMVCEEDTQRGEHPTVRSVVGVGYDCRLSGPVLRQALINGLLAGGVDVMDCGMGPTPQLYYSVLSRGLSGGVQITASHNPGDQNGLKMMIGSRTLSGESIQTLKNLVLKLSNQPAGEFRNQVTGELTEFDAHSAYLAELISRSRSHVKENHGLKVVIDGGNGVGGLIGPQLLRELGCEVVEIYTEPDGRFPNHHPDPTVVENLVDLQAKVLSEGADLGISFDGDADRLGVVDEAGRPIFGDMLLILYGRQLLSEVERPVIIADVKCSQLFFDVLRQEGAETIMSKTGHSLIKARLKELKAHLAGEMSGHMFFAHRYFGFDDAMHASARLIEILSQERRPLSSLLADLPEVVSTPEIRLDCPDEIKFLVAKRAQSAFPEYQTTTIDGVRVRFAEGWGLVRASNTQPALVLRFEAGNASQLQSYRKIVEGRLEQLISDVTDEIVS